MITFFAGGDGAKMMIPTTVHDISVPLGTGSVAYPGDPPFELRRVASFETGPFTLSHLAMSAHAGTHLDFPAHVVARGADIAGYPAARFILSAVVVDVPPDAAYVTHEDVLRAGLEPGDAVLFRTRNSADGVCRSGGWTDRYVCLTPEAGRACLSAEASLAGIDGPSVDRFDDEGLPVHRILLANDILVLERIDLSGISAGRYTLVCLPLPISGCEASPVRAVLLG